jgi:hypothetical protein
MCHFGQLMLKKVKLEWSNLYRPIFNIYDNHKTFTFHEHVPLEI